MQTFSYNCFHQLRLERDNRMLVAGDWYDVVYNEHDKKTHLP